MAIEDEPLWDPASPSILDHVREHVPPDGSPGLLPGGGRLPDDDPDEAGIKWAPGAKDGVVTHHATVGSDDAAVDALFAALQEANGAEEGRPRLYVAARGVQAIAVADPLLARIRSAGLTWNEVHPTARWLVFEARHREPLKLGIVLMGLGHGTPDRAALEMLGRHDEFTPFVSVALANTSRQPERELWELARVVNGWGRIDLVERLRNTTDPEIRAWIFHEGFRNEVMDEYLAYIAATTGDLAGRLEGQPDAATVDAACDIVSALLAGGPAEDIHDYADAPRALSLLLPRLRERPERLRYLVVADGIEWFLADPDGAPARGQAGWSEGARRDALALVEEIRALPHWGELIHAGLESDDPGVFADADRAGRALGFDTFPAHLRRVTADPLGPGWWALMRQTDGSRIGEVAALAERSLPLDQIASGPALELGLGPEWAAHRALTFILQDLRRFPGEGWPLIRTGLRSPVMANRNTAITALFAWPREAWPPDGAEVVERARRDEPDERVRGRLERLARGEPDE